MFAMWFEFDKESQRFRAEINRLEMSIKAQEQTIADVKNEKDEMERELKEVESYISKYLLNGKYGALTKDQFANIFNIYNNTPLSLEAAAAVVYYSDYYGVRYSLILSIIEIESNFSQYLVGAAEDRGYMQIIPMTEKYLVDMFGKNIGLEYNPDMIFDPDYNLGLGISYVAYLQQRHGEDLDKILTEYNRGAGGMAEYFRDYATYSSNYSRAVINRQEKYLLLEDRVKNDRQDSEDYQ